MFYLNRKETKQARPTDRQIFKQNANTHIRIYIPTHSSSIDIHINNNNLTENKNKQ